MKIIGLILLSFIGAWLIAVWLNWGKNNPYEAGKDILPGFIILSFLSVGIYLLFFK
jgi:ABC-type Mn2+/Zn2+ transport system permease subunit